jgi:hypothetical protein
MAWVSSAVILRPVLALDILKEDRRESGIDKVGLFNETCSQPKTRGLGGEKLSPRPQAGRLKIREILTIFWRMCR